MTEIVYNKKSSFREQPKKFSQSSQKTVGKCLKGEEMKAQNKTKRSGDKIMVRSLTCPAKNDHWNLYLYQSRLYKFLPDQLVLTFSKIREFVY